jgi:hypothetical protein
LRYTLSLNVHHGNFEESLTQDGRPIFAHKAKPGQPSTIALGSLTGGRESSVAFIALYGIGCYDFPSQVLQGQGNQQPGRPQGTADQGYDDRGENYLTAVQKIVSDLNKLPDWDRFGKTLRAISPAVETISATVPQVTDIALGYRIGDGIRPFSLGGESDGVRRFFAHLLALYQTPAKQTLFFEHPETGLHPGALSALAAEFKRCPNDGRGQVILTTHSPQLLDCFPVEAIRVVEIREQVTRIAPLAREQVEAVHKHLLFPSELLTVDPARTEAEEAAVQG